MELRDYLRIIRNRKWIIIQAVFLITTVAVVFSLLQPRAYIATAKILFQERSSASLLGVGRYFASYQDYQTETSIQTQIELIKLPSVAQKATKYLNRKTPASSIAGRAQIERVGETNLVQISVQDSSPGQARDIANAFAKGYVEWGKEYRQRQLRIARQQLRNKLQETREEILQLGKEIESRGDKVPREMQIKLNLATDLYTALYQKYEELRIEETMEGGGIEVAALADKPVAPIKPTPSRNGVLGGIAGLIFGAAIAFFVEYLDNTVKTPEDAERYFQLPILGQIPRSDLFNGKKGEQVVVWADPKSIVAEAFRTLRTNISYLNFDGSTDSIVITSGGPEEGKTAVTANLAATLAAAGSKVAVVGADLRRAKLHKLFSVDNSKGLTKVLTGEVALKDALQTTGIKNLYVIPSGPLPPNPSELLGSARMHEVIEQLKKEVDFVLIDSPPVLAVTDSAVLARKADGVFIVAGAGATTRESARYAKKTLENVGARMLGVVLNGVPAGKEYGYYYYYPYASDSKKGKGESVKDIELARRSRWIYAIVYLLLLVLLYFVDEFLNLGIFASILRYLSLLGNYILSFLSKVYSKLF